MKCFRNLRKQRVRIVTGSVALFIGLGISLVSVFPVYSQVVPGPEVICYSVVTLEEGVDLRDLATRYNTTVEEIQRRNSTAPLLPGINLTIQENTIREKTIKRIQTVSRGSVIAWNWPMIGGISQAYGSKNGDFHHGLDIANASGSIVRAARAGKVTKADWFGVYGITVMIDHGNGVQTLYAHNSKLLVKVGDAVSAGEEISLSGNTGNSTGPHLHFEIRHNGRTVDPEDYLPKTLIVRL